MEKFDQKKYDAQYKREHYDQIKFNVPKGKKKEIQQYAEDHGLTMTELFIRLLEVGCQIYMDKQPTVPVGWLVDVDLPTRMVCV